MLISLLFLIITLIIDYVFYWFPKLLQGLLNFSSVPVVHYLQVVLFIKIWTIFMNILYNNSQHSLKSGGTKDHFRWVKVPGTLKGLLFMGHPRDPCQIKFWWVPNKNYEFRIRLGELQVQVSLMVQNFMIKH